MSFEYHESGVRPGRMPGRLRSCISDWAAGISLQRKLAGVLFPVLVLFPLALLVLGQGQDRALLNNALVICCVAGVILLMPLASGLSHLLALRDIRDLNDQCHRFKQGDYSRVELPPANGREQDFLQLKRNLHWMGYAIASRERKLSAAMDNLAEAQHKVVESIDYASLIQSSFLPDESRLEQVFREYFLFWEQRDKVGGDFYWFRQCEKGFFVAVIDCTGHGVPGAFMTLIVQSLLDRVATESGGNDPAALLSRLNRLIKEALGQNEPGGMSDDGLDCALCHVDSEHSVITFAGANNSLYVLEGGEFSVIKGDRCGIGYVRTPRNAMFTNHVIEYRKGMRLFMTTDGLIDQVGGERKFPFGKTRFKRFCAEHERETLGMQGLMLRAALESYQGNEPRRDDVTVLGFEL